MQNQNGFSELRRDLTLLSSRVVSPRRFGVHTYVHRLDKARSTRAARILHYPEQQQQHANTSLSSADLLLWCSPAFWWETINVDANFNELKVLVAQTITNMRCCISCTLYYWRRRRLLIMHGVEQHSHQHWHYYLCSSRSSTSSPALDAN